MHAHRDHRGSVRSRRRSRGSRYTSKFHGHPSFAFARGCVGCTSPLPTELETVGLNIFPYTNPLCIFSIPVGCGVGPPRVHVISCCARRVSPALRARSLETTQPLGSTFAGAPERPGHDDAPENRHKLACGSQAVGRPPIGGSPPKPKVLMVEFDDAAVGSSDSSPSPDKQSRSPNRGVPRGSNINR